MSDSLQPRGVQHFRLSCPLLYPGVCLKSCPLSQFPHCPLLLLPSIFPSVIVFSKGSALHIRGPKYWSFSFSISPSNEYSVLISIRIDWFDLLAVQGALKSLLQKIQRHLTLSVQPGELTSLWRNTKKCEVSHQQSWQIIKH